MICEAHVEHYLLNNLQGTPNVFAVTAEGLWREWRLSPPRAFSLSQRGFVPCTWKEAV